MSHYSTNIINVLKNSENGIWKSTFVYEEPRTELRYQLWDRRFIKAQWSGPWVCAGDFNEVLSSD